MRFYTQQHKHYCGIDLHARSMYICLLDQAGTKLVWDGTINEITPGVLPKGMFAAGETVGTHELADIEREGTWAGLQAAAFDRPWVSSLSPPARFSWAFAR